jgi:hypothetical protein
MARMKITKTQRAAIAHVRERLDVAGDDIPTTLLVIGNAETRLTEQQARTLRHETRRLRAELAHFAGAA